MIAGVFFLVAALYATVGPGGASGYLAVMALAGFEPAAMKPTALVLNVVVSLIGTVIFVRAGHFAWRLFWPFAVVAAPCAYVGGGWQLSAEVFRWLVAAALLFAAGRLLIPAALGAEVRRPSGWVIVVVGASIGFLSGLIGVGGGIFLTPLILFFRWAEPKTAADCSAMWDRWGNCRRRGLGWWSRGRREACWVRAGAVEWRGPRSCAQRWRSCS